MNATGARAARLFGERKAAAPVASAATGGRGSARNAASGASAAANQTEAKKPTIPRSGGSSQPPSDAAPGWRAEEPASGITDAPWVVAFSDAEDRKLALPEVLKALRAGEVSGGTLVWRRGMKGWQPLSEVPELAPYLDALQDDEPTRNDAKPPGDGNQV